MTDKFPPEKRCENCRWFAVWAQERILGLCGHRESAGEVTSKNETCERHEERE